MNEKIRRVRHSIRQGHYDPKTLEGELAQEITTDRLAAFLIRSISTPSTEPNGGAATAGATDSP